MSDGGIMKLKELEDMLREHGVGGARFTFPDGSQVLLTIYDSDEITVSWREDSSAIWSAPVDGVLA